MTQPLTLAEIRQAAAIIGPAAHRTPVLTSPLLDGITGGEVLAKDESTQRAGSFKFRGAFHRLSLIPEGDRSGGVVAVSSGNHGAAVACAAAMLAMPAVVYIPDDAPVAKRSLIESFGAEVVTFDRATSDREGPARERAAAGRATFVHPFEDRDVMLGQGTTALELFEQVGEVDALLVPMSGGGLMAGCGSAMRALVPTCRLIGVEPAAADDTLQSWLRGHPVRIEPPTTIADGLALVSPGVNTFSLNRDLLDDVVTVTDREIITAMVSVFDAVAVVLEPSGAVGVAALLAHPDRWRDQRVGVILSGGNIDRPLFAALTGR